MKKIKRTANSIGLAALLCPLFIFLSGTSFAQGSSPSQTQEITGTVKGENNQPLQGVTVLEKGTSNGVSTDEKGVFLIHVHDKAVLVLTMTGYKGMEMPVSGRKIIDINLVQASKDLNEVVVIGYGTRKKKDLTGSVASVSSKDLEQRVVINPLDALEGKVPGLNINNNTGAPGGTFSMTIRGFGSINASSSPLFVIDGIVGADIQSINPNDIESVDILKDASSTAIYGSRGANGVIIVTTRRPRNGAFELNYQVNGGLSHIAKKVDMIDSKGWLEMFNRSWAYDPNRGTAPNLGTVYPDLFKADGSPIYNTNWQDAATRNAISNRHYLSLQQATDKSRTGLYLGYQNENGILLNSQAKKYSARFTTDYYLRNWLTVGGSLAFNSSRQNRAAEYGIGSENATRQLYEFLPIFPVKFPNGKYSTLMDFGFGFNADGSYYPTGTYGASNPVQILNQVQYITYNDQILGNLYASIKLNKDLEFRSSFAAQVLDGKTNTYVGKTVLDIGSPSNGVGEVDNSRNIYWQTDNYLSYNKSLTGGHQLNAVVGTSWYKLNEEDVTAGSTGYSTDYYQYNNLGAGNNWSQPTSKAFSYSLNSYYARLNYSYRSKYLLTVTGRYDGASKFGTDNKYAFFPSGALGWIVSEEPFLQAQKTISFLKLRASYGVTGNSEINPYSSLGTINNYTVIQNGQTVVGAAQGNAPNPDLKWEQTAQADLGLDMRFLQDRLYVTADYYHKKTTNLLLANPISYVTGYSTVTTNIGSLQNKGIELSIGGAIIREKDIEWNAGLTYAANRNKVLALGTNNADIYPGPNFQGQTNILRVGESIGSIWGLTRLGTWGTAEASQAAVYNDRPGDIKRLDRNKDGVIDNNDASILGNMFPRYDLTFNTSFRYKNWELGMDIQVRQGNKNINFDSYTVEDRQWYASGYSTVVRDAWTPQHQNTMVPALRFNGDHNFSDAPGYIDSRWVEDGSFIRGKSINLAYQFNKAFTNRIGFHGLRVFANAQNFFLLTHYRGSDPEVSSIPGGGTFTQGMEFFGYPKPRTYTIGINANF